jgi:hypothetical protein
MLVRSFHAIYLKIGQGTIIKRMNLVTINVIFVIILYPLLNFTLWLSETTCFTLITDDFKTNSIKEEIEDENQNSQTMHCYCIQFHSAFDA